MSLQKKFEQAARATDRYTDIIVKDRVYAAYKQSLDTVRKQTATLYEKHAKDGILSMSEVSKYNRLGNLEKDIAAEMTRLGGKQVRATTKAIKDVYQESAYRTAYALNTEMPDIAMNFGLLPTKQVEASVINPISIKWPESVKFNTITATKQIREAITAGIIQGKSYPDVARVIKEKFDMAAYKAERIVRTEAHRARSMGQLATLEEAHEQGVPMLKVWITAMDQRVRDIHGPMDGQKVEMFDEDGNPGLFWDGNNNKAPAPGMFGVAKSDINCRCAMRGEVPGYEPTERRERLTEEEYQARKAAEAERAVKEGRDPLPIARSEIKPYRTYPEYAKEKGFPMLYKGAEPRITDIGVSYSMIDAVGGKELAEVHRAMLQSRGYTDEQIDGMVENLKKLNANAELTIRVPSDVIADVLEDGRFKTQFESQTSGGALNPRGRLRAEEFLYNAPADLAPELRPVYGYLSDVSTSLNAQAYGDVKVILKDSVRNRTTVVYSDSLYAAQTGQKGASFINNPQLNSVTHPRLGALSKAKGLDDIAHLYPEMQVHGGVGLGDIKEIIFKRMPDEYTANLLDEKKVKWRVGVQWVEENMQ